MDRSNASDHSVHNKSLDSTSQKKTWHLVIRNEASLQQASVVSCLPAARWAAAPCSGLEQFYLPETDEV